MRPVLGGEEMIHVDRSRVAVPLILAPGGLAESERESARDFYLSTRHRQSQFDFNAFRAQEVRSALFQLFQGKCAYCETPITREFSGDVELFRPASAVVENAKHFGYWWLATDWENLLISCVVCNRQRYRDLRRAVTGKANRFPLADEAKRALGPDDDLRREAPLLLDPCVDDPDEHLMFDWSGRVESDTPRGQITIAVLDLNRPDLLEARSIAAARIKVALAQTAGYNDSPNSLNSKGLFCHLLPNFEAMARADAAYAGMTRQLMHPHIDLLRRLGGQNDAFDWFDHRKFTSDARRHEIGESFRKFEAAQSSFSLATEEGKQMSRAQRRDIQCISIRNFKGLRDIEIDLAADGPGGGWLMLLGENSTGKTSILQAIALCLAGADYFATLVKDRRLLPGDLVNSNARKAIVSVKMTGFVEAHEMTVTAEGASFKRSSGKVATADVSSRGEVTVLGDEEARQVQFVMLGYGATRLLPRWNEVGYGQRFARIDNLFDAFLPLRDANAWLTSAKQHEFDEVALALKDLLSLDRDAILRRQKGGLIVQTHWDRAPINRLSDGFQSVVAMSVDLLEVVVRLWGTPRNAEGIVLLDEIGAHLHPTWKMRIVGSLRRAFPGMQFVSTTHDPLCLRGLGKGEVVVMRRGLDGNVEAVSGLPSPSDFRVEQLLTSEFFGLRSTVDPDTEALFDRYYALLALSDRDSDQVAELRKLQQELHERRLVGDTLRDQLMFEAVDQVIARHQGASTLSLPQMKAEAKAAIAHLWDESVSSILVRQ